MRPGTLRGIGWALLVASTAACGAETVDPVPTVDPGALIGVSISSRVGFVLDEIPLGERDRIVDALVALDEEAWLARARRQVKHTSYRLIFREYYFLDDNLLPIDADGDGRSDRLNLPLPPESLWQVTLDASPTRVDIDGHDVLVAPYTMQTVIVTDTASPGISEPSLAEVGGVWEEPFVSPGRSRSCVFQRTGYACMDEVGFPRNSVDSEETAASSTIRSASRRASSPRPTATRRRSPTSPASRPSTRAWGRSRPRSTSSASPGTRPWPRRRASAT
jgi:hypothetical protein